MNKVTTINLNGRAYQLEEQAYEPLRAYLDEAARLLADDPDCREILADLEQAIADKGARYLGAGKNVLTEAEMMRILQEMGPVEPGEQDAAEPVASGGAGTRGTERAAAPPPRDSAAAPKRLYQLKQGAMISGVCNGLAAYFGMDPTIMRLIFVLLLFLTSGVWILAYLLLMFVMPVATTAEERAAASGRPFDAQELVKEAKRHYAQIKEGHQRWRARRQRERERRFWQRREERNYEAHTRPFPEPQPGYGAQVAAGIMLPLTAIVSALLTVVWVIALLSLLATGAIIGWELPSDTPMWTGVLALIAIYAVVSWPLRAARYASYRSVTHPGWFVVWDSLLWLGMVALLSWMALRYVPAVRELIHDLPHQWSELTELASSYAYFWSGRL
jgi:phage shock protein PspC (stress-responsive transcriptional regulator)